MELRRKGDNKLLCRDISKWSGWRPNYKAPVIETVNNVPYIQPIGVATELQELTLMFADHFPGSTEANLWALVDAHRKSRQLTFLDSKNELSDCYVYEPITEINRWEAVKTRDIYRVPVVLVKAGYIR